MNNHCFNSVIALCLVVSSAFAGSTHAADNQLTAAERQQGWLLLFNGQNLDGWMTSASKPSQKPIEQGCINLQLELRLALTPALSPREREKHFRPGKSSPAGGSCQRGRRWFTLLAERVRVRAVVFRRKAMMGAINSVGRERGIYSAGTWNRPQSEPTFQSVT